MRSERRRASTAPRAVFIDSSAFYALTDESDRHHTVARALMEKLAEAGTRLHTTNFILAESHQLLLARTRRVDTALAFLTRIYHSEHITIIRVGPADEQSALAILTRYTDKQFSFTDATSFAIMERLRIRHAFTFDADFAQYGLLTLQAEQF